MANLEYRPAIDGLRAVAVLAVFVFHLDHRWLPGGFVGVDIFFVISGYLITSIILRNCESDRFSLSRFYQRRIARIFPAFFFAALITLLGASIIYTPQDFASAGANLVAATLSLANMKFMLQGDYFEISPDAQPFLHYWSLSVEEQFYMVFPLFFLLLFKYCRKHIALILALVCGASLIACVAVTWYRPTWAFFLLPTRAWELFAGALLAVMTRDRTPFQNNNFSTWIPCAGLLLIVFSLVYIHGDMRFPGWLAVLPVLGAVAVILPTPTAHGLVERLLSAPVLVGVGRMSYSLYLWHWPVFSLVDYQCYLAPPPVRLALKVGLSFAGAAISFRLIEAPSRALLNQQKRKLLAYASLAVAVVICVPLGITIRKANYVNAQPSDVAKGGLIFPGEAGAGSVILMGDSNGSMYGKVMRAICANLGYDLTVISVAGGNPLPSSSGKNDELWLDSLAVIENRSPDVLVLGYFWSSKLEKDRGCLGLALDSVLPHVGRCILLNQPPILPDSANRASIRDGGRPPFNEDQQSQIARVSVNRFLEGFASENIVVIDIAQVFELEHGEVRFLDDRGLLYHDKTHLSGYGADLIRPLIEGALKP